MLCRFCWRYRLWKVLFFRSPDIMLIPMVLATPKSVAYCRFGNGCKRGRRLFRLCDRFYGYDLIARPILDFYGYSHQFDAFWRDIIMNGGVDRFRSGDYAVSYKVITIARRCGGSESVGFRGWIRWLRAVCAFIVAWLLKNSANRSELLSKRIWEYFRFCFCCC